MPQISGRSRPAATPLDVLFYTPWIGSLLRPGVGLPTGGAETQILLVSRELAARGHNVGLVAFDLPGGLPTDVDGVRVLSRPPYKAHRRLVGKFIETWWIWRSLKRHRAAVVVKRAAGIDVGLVAVFARLRGQRFVFSSANVVDFNFHTLMPNRRDLFLYRLGIRLAGQVIVQTDEQTQLCERHFKRRPVTIRSIAEPVSDMRRQLTAESGAFIWAGRLVSYKRPLAFIDLARAMPDARFVMVGVPVAHGQQGIELVSRVRCAAAALPNLELLEPVARAELGRLISSSVAVVNTADYEGMSNVSLEAWAHGVPTLALMHDPDGVIARYRLGGFAGGSPERLRELAQQLWVARDHRPDLVRRCREYVARHHSPSAVAEQWERALGLTSTKGRSAEMTRSVGEPACVE